MKSHIYNFFHNTWIKHGVPFVGFVKHLKSRLMFCCVRFFLLCPVLLKDTRCISNICFGVQCPCSDQGSRSSSEGQRRHGPTATLRHTGAAAAQDIRRQVRHKPLHCCCQHWWHESWLCVMISPWFTGSFNALLRELVAEFTLTDNSANTTTSLLRSLCHYDDSVLMGSWLQETDHKSIEDQVITLKMCRK